MPPIHLGQATADAHHSRPDSRTPARVECRCDGDGKARACCAAVWRLRFCGCGCNRGPSAANPASTKRLESREPPSIFLLWGLVENQSRSTLNIGLAMLHASRRTKSGGIVVCCWVKRRGLRVLVLRASVLLPWAGNQTGRPGDLPDRPGGHCRDVDDGRSSRVQVFRSVRSPAAPEGDESGPFADKARRHAQTDGSRNGPVSERHWLCG
ncbi:hypothetical protein QBC39DRAFT_161614 [Podospora conica]|nr:hypothetical protein QBC39DRAFT_161614 [Schizothecium conicum]